MDSISCMKIVRDSLRTNLTDPYATAGGNSRDSSTWIFCANEPHSAVKYPQIELGKLDNPTEVIDIGYNYMEFEELYINVWFYTKNGFKVTIGGIEYTNGQLVEYYQGLIKTTLKAQASTLHDADAKMYKHINTSKYGYDKDTQMYYGNVVVRLAYFNR